MEFQERSGHFEIVVVIQTVIITLVHNKRLGLSCSIASKKTL